MSRLSFRDFNKYLILSPPADEISINGLRRARGVNAVKTSSIRSRAGNALFNSIASCTSCCMFMGNLFQFVGNNLYRDGIILKGITGNYLSFLSVPPTAEKRDYLFISNGDACWKVDVNGTVTKWGIDAPPDGFTATLQSALYKDIETFEDPGAVARWTASGITVTASTGYYVSGTQSLNLAVAVSSIGTIKQDIDLDLSTFSTGEEASLADYIVISTHIDYPTSLEYIMFQFSIGDTTFGKNIYTRQIDYAPGGKLPASEASKDKSSTGIGDLDEYSTNESEEKSQAYYVDSSGRVSTDAKGAVRSYVAEALEDADLKHNNWTWKQFKLAKSLFTRAGGGNYDWSDVKSVKITVKTNSRSAVNIKIDDFKLIGGTGMQGNYKYFTTFYNSNTGNRSNSNETPVKIEGNLRQSIALANLPVATDTQVTNVEIWRTVGNGAVYFKAGSVVNGTTTFTDNIADAYMLDPREDAEYLESTSLPVNNIVPYSTFGPTALYNSAVFWIDRNVNNSGNLYYSPVGYAESVDGFIRVTHSNDALQTICVWNGVPYVFSKAKVFMITGTSPYYSKEVFGVPGTIYPQTVIPTPYGILYQSYDGVRLFNGARSEVVSWINMGRLWAGENIENLTLFIGSVACFSKNEYFISDGSQTLVYRPSDDTWRDFGVGFTSLYTDPLTGSAYGSNSNGTHILEQVGVVTDNNTPIPFEVETRQTRFDVDKFAMVNHLHLDIITNNQNINLTLISDNTETDLGIATTASREVVTVPISRSINRLGIRLTGNLTEAVEIYGIEWDVDLSQQQIQDRYIQKLLA